MQEWRIGAETQKETADELFSCAFKTTQNMASRQKNSILPERRNNNSIGYAPIHES